MKSNGFSRQVLIIAKAYPPEVGGVESYSEFIARAYLARGVVPVVVSSWGGPRGWVRRQHPEGCIEAFNVGRGPQLLVFLLMIAACTYLRIVRKFDFLHPTTWRPAVAALLVSGRLPVVLTVHGQEISCCPKWQSRVMIWVLRSVDLLVAVSHSTMQITREAMGDVQPRGKWSVNFNGLSYLEEAATYDRPPSRADKPLRIVSFSRLAERKNIPGCLRAVSLLRAEGLTNFTYTIAGTGPLKSKVEGLIAELDLGSLVRMAGYVRDEDIPDLYKNTDIFLHPQTAAQSGLDLEGFGLAIADSMSFGAAAVVGKDGGPADFVLQNERGLVVDGNDDLQIAEALRALLTSPNLKDELSRTGREWCLSNLSWDRHVMHILYELKLNHVFLDDAASYTSSNINPNH